MGIASLGGIYQPKAGRRDGKGCQDVFQLIGIDQVCIGGGNGAHLQIGDQECYGRDQNERKLNMEQSSGCRSRKWNFFLVHGIFILFCLFFMHFAKNEFLYKFREESIKLKT